MQQWQAADAKTIRGSYIDQHNDVPGTSGLKNRPWRRAVIAAAGVPPVTTYSELQKAVYSAERSRRDH